MDLSIRFIKSRIQSLSAARKSALVFVFASALSSGLNFITMPIFTRLMPLDEYGIVALYASWHQMLNVIATFSITNAIINVGFHNYPNDRKGFLSSALGVASLFSAFITIIIFCTLSWFSSISMLSISLIILLVLSFYFPTATQLWLCLQRYEYRYKRPFFLLTISHLGSTLLAVILVASVKNNYAEVKIWGTNLIPLIVGVVFYINIIKNGKKFFNSQYWKFILAFNAPLIIHYFSQFVLSGSDRIMIGFLQDESSVAIYSLGYSISNIILIFWNPINSSVVPYIHKCIDNNDSLALARCFYIVLVIVGVLCMSVSLLAPEVVSVLGSHLYKDACYVIPPVIVGTFFIIFYSLTANIEFLYGKTPRIALMTIIAALTNIILNIIFIPKFGYVAAAYTTLFSYMMYSLLHYINMLRLHKKRFMNELLLIVICLFTIVPCIACSLIYEYNVIRYILVLVLVATFIVLYKKIKNVLFIGD